VYGQLFDQIWHNKGTGNWFTPGNWTAGDDNDAGVPTATPNALVNNGGTAQIGLHAVASALSIGVPDVVPTDEDLVSRRPALLAAASALVVSRVEILNGGFLQIGTEEAGGPLTIGAAGNLIVDAGGGFRAFGPIENDGNILLSLGTFFGTFDGAGSITKLGDATVTFQVELSNLAHVFVDDGTLIDSSTSIGTVVVTGPNSVLRVNSGISLETAPTVNNGGTVDNFGNITADVISNTGAGNVVNEAECYGIYTQFFESAPVSSYATVGAEAGHHFTWNVEGRNLDLGYLSLGLYTEQGNHYSSGHFRVGSAGRF
jgi:hypothetical protein